MSNLRLPLRNRHDVMIYTFPIDWDPEKAAEKTVRNLRASQQGDAPPLRVVPLTDRAAYDEALALAMEKTSREVGPSWLVDAATARFAVRPKGTTEARELWLRVIQVLVN